MNYYVYLSNAVVRMLDYAQADEMPMVCVQSERDGGYVEIGAEFFAGTGYSPQPGDVINLTLGFNPDPSPENKRFNWVETVELVQPAT